MGGMSETPLEPLDDATGPRTVRDEIHDYLMQDESRLGDVYRLRREGVTDDEEIGERLGVNTSRFGWNADRQARTLLEHRAPTSPSVARQALGRINTALRSDFPFSPEARQYLEELRDDCEVSASNSASVAAQDRRLAEMTDRAEAAHVPGIYAYTLPHYLDYPKYPDTGATLMKVGHSSNSAIQRFRDQTRTTALPEEPVLLRIFTIPEGRDTGEVERLFHSALKSAPGAEYVVQRSAGTEWFPATVEFLDSMARLAGLGRFYAAEDEASESEE